MMRACLRGETIHPTVLAADTGPRQLANLQLMFEKALLVFLCLFPSLLALPEHFNPSCYWSLVSFTSCKVKV